VDQAAGDVKAEAKNPQNKKNDEDSPKLIFFFAGRASTIIQIKTGAILFTDSR
jgi:hypothetical protein